MPKRDNQKIRILCLLKIFREYTDEENALTRKEIEKKLSEYDIEVERKTFADDINALRLFSSINGDRDYIEKTSDNRYYLSNREFELPELKLLVDAVQASKFITHKKSKKLIEKIETFASKKQTKELQRQVYVDNRIKTENESIYYAVDHIHEAINKKVKITFLYFTWDVNKHEVYKKGGEKYVISPWALVWDDENYYMVGYDSTEKRIKHFRVDKMIDTVLTENERDGAEHFKNFDTALYSRQTFGMFGGKEEHVTLRCTNKNEIVGIIIDRFGKDVKITNITDSHFEIHVKVCTSPLFYSWLMNFGSDIKILAPPSVIDGYLKLAREGINQYEEND